MQRFNFCDLLCSSEAGDAFWSTIWKGAPEKANKPSSGAFILILPVTGSQIGILPFVYPGQMIPHLDLDKI